MAAIIISGCDRYRCTNHFVLELWIRPTPRFILTHSKSQQACCLQCSLPPPPAPDAKGRTAAGPVPLRSCSKLRARSSHQRSSTCLVCRKKKKSRAAHGTKTMCMWFVETHYFSPVRPHTNLKRLPEDHRAARGEVASVTCHAQKIFDYCIVPPTIITVGSKQLFLLHGGKAVVRRPPSLSATTPCYDSFFEYLPPTAESLRPHASRTSGGPRTAR